MNKVIEINNLSKSFGEVQAVKDLTFSVKKGELFAFLGVNGAGKSTTISILCGHQYKDKGTVLINGIDIDKDKTITKELGVVFQNSVLDKALTVKENLFYKGALYGLSKKECERKLDELDTMLNIKSLYKRTVGKLSGGQKRRIDVARALIHEPSILVLDEPTTGLDPATRKAVWNVIDVYRKQKGLTVLLTTHYMEETTDADYVVIIDSGSIVAQGTPYNLKSMYTGDFITVYGKPKSDLEVLGYPMEEVPQGYRIAVPNTSTATSLITAHPDLFVDYEVTKGKMDDVFLHVTGKKIMEM